MSGLSKTAQMYKRVSDVAKADAVAWVFTSEKSGLEKYPYLQPEIQPHEVRGKILYTGLCQSDVSWARKHWLDDCTYPLCTGHEIVAEIAQVGSAVKDFKVGDIVGSGWQRDACHTCHDCSIGSTNTCTDGIINQFDPYFGGYSTHTQISEKLLCKIPDGMDLTRVPPLLCAGVTVFAPMLRWQKRQVGGTSGLKATVVGPGGLGHLAIQYFKAMGCEVTTLTNIRGNETELKQLGTDNIVYTDEKGALEHLAMTQHMVMNTSPFNGGDFFSELTNIMRKRGTLCQIAIPDKKTRFSVVPNTLIFNQLNIEGSIVGSKGDMEDVLEFSAKHNIYPICEQYSFDDFPVALDKLENGAPKFRCVVDCQSWAKEHGLFK